MRAVRADILALAVCALLLSALVAAQWGVFAPRADEATKNGFGLHTFDFHAYFLPRYVYGNRELLAGRLPTWNRLEFAGQPFLATIQPAVLYPPKLLCFALFPTDSATPAFLILHQLWLAAGALLFLRAQRVGAFGAFTGAAFLAFNSTLFGANHHPNQLASVAWIPWIFLCADRAARSRRRTPIAALALVVALQLLAGYPEFTLQTALLLAVAAAVWLALGVWPRPPLATLMRVGSGFALAAAIAGLQLLPFAELASLSARSQAAAAFVEQASPDTGTLDAATLARLTLLWCLPGVAALSLAGLLRRSAAAPAALVALCLAMLLGLWLVVRDLPALAGIRHARMWLLTLQFPLAWLVALGADALVARAPRRAVDLLAGALAAAAALLGAAVCLASLAPTPEAAEADGARYGLAALRGLASDLHGTPDLTRLRALGAFALALAALAPLRLARAVLAGAAVLLLLGAQVAAWPMGPNAGPLRRHDPPETRATPPAPAAGEFPGRWLSLNALRWGTDWYARRESLFGFEQTLPTGRQRELPSHFGVGGGFHLVNWSALAAAEGFLDALDVETLVVPFTAFASFSADGRWSNTHSPAPGYQMVLHNEERPGRAWVTYAAHVAATPEAARDRLFAPDFDPRAEVILEAPPAQRYAAPGSAPPATPARAEAPSPTRFSVDVELPRPGILVVSESWYPGWRAWVDGEPREILRANYLLRGLELAPGRHRVRFEYRPWSVRLGAALSLAGIACAAWLVSSDRRARRA